ncbi:MAG: exosortase/archaeosortase family protein [Syntrophales bacterium]
MNIKQYANIKNTTFFVFFLLAFLMTYPLIKALYYSSSQREYYSHIVLIPLVSLYLLYQERMTIFVNKKNTDSRPGKHDNVSSSFFGASVSKETYSFFIGIPLLLIGVLLYFGGQHLETRLNQNDFTSMIAASSVIFINAAFILCYGMEAFKVAIFPLFFLIFIIPIPSYLMDNIVRFLQIGSTEFTNLLFMATGVPFFREGFVFHLPSLSVEVAPQCSGIRSGLALFITALLAGHLFLRTWWKKILLVVCVVPITMFKNGIRITTLTLLGNYVDPRVLQSSLHREGGIPFFIVALLLMMPILFFLRKSEKTEGKGKSQNAK